MRRPLRAADYLSARRRCHVAMLVILLHFSITKKSHKNILRIEIFFGNLIKTFFRIDGAPPPTKIDRRAAADTMELAHDSTSESSFGSY